MPRMDVQVAAQEHSAVEPERDLTRVHLVREAWWRETGRWGGPEVHRDPNPSLAMSSTAKKRHERRKCWCGNGQRYTRCHGSMPAAQELAVLGIDDDPTPAERVRAA